MKKQNQKLVDVRKALSGRQIQPSQAMTVQGGTMGEFPWQLSI